MEVCLSCSQSDVLNENLSGRRQSLGKLQEWVGRGGGRPAFLLLTEAPRAGVAAGLGSCPPPDALQAPLRTWGQCVGCAAGALTANRVCERFLSAARLGSRSLGTWPPPP